MLQTGATAAVAREARAGRHGRVLLSTGIAYGFGTATICALTGAVRPLVLHSDVLTGWATLLRNSAAFAYRELSGADLRALVNDPAVLATDIALTALGALVNVLVVEGIYAFIRGEKHPQRRTHVLLVAGATLLCAAIATAVVSTLCATAFYGALSQLPVE